jgi:hypothetical protein
MHRQVRMVILLTEFIQEGKMPEILDYMRRKFDWFAGKILELFSGSNEYRVREVKERVPDVRKIVGARLAERFPPSGGDSCDRY